MDVRLSSLARRTVPAISQSALRAHITPASCQVMEVTKSVAGFGPVPEEAKSKPHYRKTNHGVPVKFQNPYPSWNRLSQWTMFRRMMVGMMSGAFKYPDTTPPTVPVVKPKLLADRFGSQELRTTWLGHACHYVEFPSGLRVLFDPVMEDRCSPFSFMGPKRYNPRPCGIADLPFVDAVVISHSHYDHLSHPTVQEIRKHHPNAHFFVGMGLEKWFRSLGIRNVTEMDWWDDVELTLRLGDSAPDGKETLDRLDPEAKLESNSTITAKVSCYPSQHTSSRNGWNVDNTLWCSWAIATGTPEKSVWFGGDTGYRTVPELPLDIDDYGPEYTHLPCNPQFRQIGELRGPFDLGLIPIGAYAPRFMMSCMHANPYDAVEIFIDTKCKRAIGIHWGTWTLTTEPVLEPLQKLKDALQRKGVAETGVFDTCNIGETKMF